LYFVDRKKIEKSLLYIEEVTHIYNNHGSWNSNIEKLALERIIHMTIEAIIDVGNAMIDGFIMRDPGSYEDIVEILRDENVISTNSSGQLKELITLRKQLIYGYHGISHEQLLHTIKNVEEAMVQFPTDVRSYLVNELGPVSAFIPDNKGSN
jgi:uncharacterized protein YutE (UPF0331/DUF86 family)